MNNIKKKLIIVGVLFLIVFVFIAIAILPQRTNQTSLKSLSISFSEPTNGESNFSVFDPITVTFNQPVDVSLLTIKSQPVEDWSLSQTEPDTIKINHRLYLQVGTHYQITILLKDSLIGSLSFDTAQYQNDPRQLQGLQSDLEKNYPLGSYTPYDTPDFRVVYISPLTLQIEIKGNISSQDAINKVQAWVTSHNIDPTTHKYQVLNPTNK